MTDRLTLERLRNINSVCNAFEERWLKNETPRIETELMDVEGAAKAELLRELLLVELFYKCQRGKNSDIEEYLQRYSEHKEVVKDAFRRSSLVDDTINCSGGVAHSQRQTAHLNEGDRIGRYLVVRRLGEGSFGLVYLVRDPNSDELRAVKLLRNRNALPEGESVSLRHEYQITSTLDHPGIVPVYEINAHREQPYAVMEYVQGETLRGLLRRGGLKRDTAIDLVAKIADILDFVHQRDCYHRDLKPANIIVGLDGRPRLLDFGLATREHDRWKHEDEVIGTVAYMSPEQVRGETHRLDGRSDIWSLGVILYEILAGRQPFRGTNSVRLTDEICHRPPQPPRQHVGNAYAGDYDSICLKAIAPRPADRFHTASDFAEALRGVLRRDAPSSPSLSSNVQKRIVARGLSAYEARDSDFFPRLLEDYEPGDVLPDSVEFWKTRIETSTCSELFSVGVLFGPSGVGKTSLVRAALVPVLSHSIHVIYVAARTDDLEAVLFARIRDSVVGLQDVRRLPDLIRALRERPAPPTTKRVLIIIDQFERWLRARPDFSDSALTDALRQCDGNHIQCMLIVNNEFWLQMNQFSRALDVELQDGHNQAVLDGFSKSHARNILIHFGRYYGQLPQHPDEPTQSQNRFLRGAVSQLASHGPLLPIRLSLFAEAVRTKSWTPGTLSQGGGANRISVEFLDQRFPLESAKLMVMSILGVLLPSQFDYDRTRSHQEILRRTGAGRHPESIADVLRILTDELRFIETVPLFVENISGDQDSGSPSEFTQGYRIARDSLVPILRNWLEIRQHATWKGRAYACLEQRTQLWTKQPDTRQLPGWIEWCRIILGTRRSDHTIGQKRLLKAAGKYYGLRLFGCMVLILGTIGLSWKFDSRIARDHARGLVRSVRTADFSQVPGISEGLQSEPDWAEAELSTAIDDLKTRDNETEFRFRLVRLAFDSADAESVLDSMLTLDPNRIATICCSEFLDPLNIAPKRSLAFLNRELRDNCAANVLWPDPDPTVIEIIDKAHGDVAPQFAWCQDLPAGRFRDVCDKLDHGGYRPTRIRPWQSGAETFVAAIWTRDGRAWRTEYSLTAEQLRESDRKLRAAGFQLVDLASFVDSEKSADKSLSFSAVWREERGTLPNTEILVGVQHSNYVARTPGLRENGFHQIAHSCVRLSDDRIVSSGLWQKTGPSSTDTLQIFDEVHPDYFKDLRGLSDASQYTTLNEWSRDAKFEQVRQLTDGMLDLDPENNAARFHRGRADYYLGQLHGADKDLTQTIEASGQFRPFALPLRALARAQLQRPEEAESDLVRLAQILRDLRANRNWRTAFLACLEAETKMFAGNYEEAFRRLETHLQKEDDKQSLFYAASAYSLAAETLNATDPETSIEYTYRAAELLRDAAKEGLIDDFRLHVTTDLEHLRGTTQFRELLQSDSAPLRYSAVWNPTAEFETKFVFRADLKQHKVEAGMLADLGFHPVSIGVAQPDPTQPAKSCSVWHRLPLSPDDLQNTVRLANAAAATLRISPDSDVWNLLRLSHDPTVRSLMIDRLIVFGVDPKTIVHKLFNADTRPSVRRALLQSLSEYPAATTPPNSDSVIDRLTRLYLNDPDPGVHSSALFLMKQWGIARGSQIQNSARQGGSGGATGVGWSETKSGLTMIHVPAPVEFTMGSSLFESNRGDDEHLRRERIDESYWISATEITREQFRHFSQAGRIDTAENERLLPAQVSWYDAAAYCNWLSSQENIPENEWCYISDKDGADAARMKAAPNFEERIGYRLPTEAEWEYACRAGTSTEWAHGHSLELLGRYAWYYGNSNLRIHPVASLRPNDLGLFDMSGNAAEWCQTPYSPTLGKGRTAIDSPRYIVKGGGYRYAYPHSRSAARFSLPAQSTQAGFRVVRPVRDSTAAE